MCLENGKNSAPGTALRGNVQDIQAKIESFVKIFEDAANILCDPAEI